MVSDSKPSNINAFAVTHDLNPLDDCDVTWLWEEATATAIYMYMYQLQALCAPSFSLANSNRCLLWRPCSTMNLVLLCSIDGESIYSKLAMCWWCSMLETVHVSKIHSCTQTSIVHIVVCKRIQKLYFEWSWMTEYSFQCNTYNEWKKVLTSLCNRTGTVLWKKILIIKKKIYANQQKFHLWVTLS